jgi:hypothetical protein
MASGFNYSVQISDPNNLASDRHAALLDNLSAAIDNWARYISGLGTIDVELRIDPALDGANAASTANIEIGTSDGRTLFRDGVPHELITGTDINGGEPDAIIRVGASYLDQRLWLDPTPLSRTEPVPSDKIDAVSVLTHEFGHALGMTGFGSDNGVLRNDIVSVYDSHIVFEDGNPGFAGQAVEALYGRPVPLSQAAENENNYTHYGHEPSDQLDFALMEGNTFYFPGRRYYVDNIDLAIMKDMGLTTSGQSTSAYADQMTGFWNNDYFAGGEGNDTLSGADGNDRLFGERGDDDINGGYGNDKISGGKGNDYLTGGPGKDAFLFDTDPRKSGNLDVILDFNVKEDRLRLDDAIFTKLWDGCAPGPRMLNQSVLEVGSRADDRNDYLIYDKITGILSYDQDGCGSKDAVEFAKLDKGLALSHKDIFIV